MNDLDRDVSEWTLEKALAAIRPADQAIMDEIWALWDKKAIPLRSLGRLEEMVVRLGGIYRTTRPETGKRAVIVMAADNGVIEEGVAQSDHHVTSTVTCNMTGKNATVSILARMNGADVVPVDIGMKDTVDCPGVWPRKICNGTKNMTKGPAMSRQEAVRAIETGIDVVARLAGEGYGMFATGEMGIGNTTTSSAMAALYLGCSPEMVTGRGAGLTSDGLERKVAAIHKAIEVNAPNADDPLDVLSKVGGLDIAGLTGCFLGAAALGRPIVIDGFISSIAAMTAIRMVPDCRDYIFPSHVSAEPAGQQILDALGMEAYIHGGMRLGEGTGAVTAFHLFDTALEAYYHIPEFEQAKIPVYTHLK